MNNLITYKDGVAILSSASDWQTQVETNVRKVLWFGISSSKTKGSATGWIAYTYSKTTRQFENKNNGNHILSSTTGHTILALCYQQKIKSNIQFSATWVFGTGNPYTLAAGKI